MQPGYAGTITNLRIVLNTQKNPYFNQATQQKLAKIFLPKTSRDRTFQTPKILRSSLTLEIRKSGVPPTPGL